VIGGPPPQTENKIAKAIGPCWTATGGTASATASIRVICAGESAPSGATTQAREPRPISSVQVTPWETMRRTKIPDHAPTHLTSRSNQALIGAGAVRNGQAMDFLNGPTKNETRLRR
jgi:hypothetical protein